MDMKELGVFTNKAGKKFVGNYFEKLNELEVLGPVAEDQDKTSLPQIYMDIANSEEEAVAKINEIIELF